MIRYAALLGSINVGGNRLKMADLTAALKAEGFASVSTVVASGNVLFSHHSEADAKLEQRIAGAVQARFGINTFAAIRTRAELAAVLSENPFVGEGEDKLIHVHFLECQPSAQSFATLLADHAGRGPEKLAPGTRCLHIDYVSGVGQSKLTGDFIARRVGCRGTARNVRSLRRIIEIMDQ